MKDGILSIFWCLKAQFVRVFTPKQKQKQEKIHFSGSYFFLFVHEPGKFKTLCWNRFKLCCLSFIESCIMWQRKKNNKYLLQKHNSYWFLALGLNCLSNLFFRPNAEINFLDLLFNFFFSRFCLRAILLASKSQVINQVLWLRHFRWLLWISSFN